MADDRLPSDQDGSLGGPMDDRPASLAVEALDPATLREMLLASERRRAVAEASRRQVEIILTGLELLTSVTSIDQLFHGILGIIHESVPYDAAAVLVEESQAIGVASTTDANVPFGELAPCSFLQRVFGGAPAVVTDLRMVPALAPLSTATELRSGVFVPLASSGRRAAFCCLSREIGQYATGHRDLLQSLAPLAGQALQRYQDARRVDDLVEQLDHMAHTDSLTGLANRARFTAELGRHVDRFRLDGTPFAVLMIDVDNLKVVNDTLGHHGGDQLIQAVGQALRRSVRDADIAARLGGDEFALIMSDTSSPAAVATVATRTLQEVAVPVTIETDEIIPRVSIGTSICSTDRGEPEEILALADFALYQAKAAGGATAVASSTALRHSWAVKRSIGVDLQTALADDQLVLHYQPIVGTSDDRVLGYEALLRWEHPELGLLPQESFLPNAHRSNLAGRIDRWVLRRATDEMGDWLAGDPERRLAINLGTIGPQTTNTIAEIVTVLTARGLLPAQLELELGPGLTRHRRRDLLAESVDWFRSRGPTVAFDQFGSGHWTVDHLRRLRGDRLKVDRAFVSRMLTDRTDRVVVARAIELAESLGLHAVAVGVESAAHLAELAAMGCDEVQGHHLGAPAAWPRPAADRFDPRPVAGDGVPRPPGPADRP